MEMQWIDFRVRFGRSETLTISLNGVNAPRGQISRECRGNNDRMLSVVKWWCWCRRTPHSGGLISVDIGVTVHRAAWSLIYRNIGSAFNQFALLWWQSARPLCTPMCACVWTYSYVFVWLFLCAGIWLVAGGKKTPPNIIIVQLNFSTENRLLFYRRRWRLFCPMPKTQTATHTHKDAKDTATAQKKRRCKK